VAKRLNRNSIGTEIDSKYIMLAEARLNPAYEEIFK
jgi:DNA modification methylase